MLTDKVDLELPLEEEDELGLSVVGRGLALHLLDRCELDGGRTVLELQLEIKFIGIQI